MQKIAKLLLLVVGTVGVLVLISILGFKLLRKITLAQPPATITPTGAAPVVPGRFTVAELASHNTASDCYIAYQNEVFNITWYIPRHEGGSMIVQQCGQITDDFSTIHEGGPFTKRAIQAVLQASKVGVLEVVN